MPKILAKTYPMDIMQKYGKSIMDVNKQTTIILDKENGNSKVFFSF